MNRRQLLVAVGTPGLLAGCLSDLPSEGTTPRPADGGTPTPVSGTSGDDTAAGGTPDGDGPTGDGDGGDSGNGDDEVQNLAAFGNPSTICEEEIKTDHGIEAVVEPAFASDWSAQDVDGAYRYDPDTEGLTDKQTVIGLSTDGGARAYPLTVLNVHEVVNDTLGGPVVITFCPLCRSGMVASRRVDGEVTQFAVSGLLWRPERIQTEASKKDNRTFGASATGGSAVEVSNNGNLVMYDAATHSYWSQVLAQSICGPLAGTELDIRPSSVASWGEWQARHPDTEVLLPPPHSVTVVTGEILGSDTDSNGRSE